MRCLVLGASGLVGSHLCRALANRGHTVTGTFYRHPSPGLRRLDILDRASLEALIEDVRPAVLFHCAANPDVDWCEAHPEESQHINVGAVREVVKQTRRRGAMLVYFSSDYIFDGTKGPYAEEDPPRPLNVYGRHKLAAEQIVRSDHPEYLIIRITVVYGWEQLGKNFVQRLITTLRAGRTLRVPTDQVGSPTYAGNLADAVCELVEKGCRGVYHVAGGECVNRYGLALQAAATFDLSKHLVVPVASHQLAQTAPRPLNAGLRVDNARRIISTPLMGYQEGLQRMKEEESTWKLR